MNKRCEKIRTMLLESAGPITASSLAEHFSVSRQIIVGDIALLRASGFDVIATARGYIVNSSMDIKDFPYTGIVACRHTKEQLEDELYTIVDFGATVIDVSIDHSIYGELSGKLNLSSRYDVAQFMDKVNKEEGSSPISELTGGVHLHRIGCRDKEIFDRIKLALTEKGIALE